jgi:thymidylate kinase
MFSIALIGADGAGKTTIARALEEKSSLAIKYLYMGINPGSSNVVLPTSKLLDWLKRRQNRRAGTSAPKVACRKKSTVWLMLRLLNRAAEESYRQLLSWNYRRKRWIVVYDRHFRFDFEYNPALSHENLADRLHRWFLAKIYPRPDLVIYLDAPPEVLFARKGEATLEYLAARRESFRRQGKSVANFVEIDATQPFNVVYSQVAERIMQFAELRSPQLIRPTGPVAKRNAIVTPPNSY